MVCVCVCVRARTCSVAKLSPTLCNPMAHQAPLSMGFSRQECWSQLPYPSLGYLSDPGIEPVSLVSPALAAGFFTTGATWEALSFILHNLFVFCSSFPWNFCHNKTVYFSVSQTGQAHFKFYSLCSLSFLGRPPVSLHSTHHTLPTCSRLPMEALLIPPVSMLPLS